MSFTVEFLSIFLFALASYGVLRQYIPYLRAFQRASNNYAPEDSTTELPKAAIILCLKGTDPFLERCLNGLANQKYPDYKVLIVVDSQQDESYPFARSLQKNFGEELVEVLTRKYFYSTCSLRASSFSTGLESLAEDVGVVILCDGDTVPHPHWLRDLVSTLLSQSSPVISGNRWYAPEQPTFGSLVRYFWNALAVPMMYQEGIPWAGSMAIHRDAFTTPEFRDAIRNAFSEDTKMAGHLKKQGKRAVPQPGIPVINQEVISLSSFWGFLSRQMLAARLHHPSWNYVLINAMIVGAAILVLMPLSIIAGPSTFLVWFLCYLAYGVVMHCCIGIFEWKIRRFVKRTRSQALPRFTIWRAVVSSAALITLGFIYPIAVFLAAIERKHLWRGITYRVSSKGVTILDPPIEPLEVELEPEVV